MNGFDDTTERTIPFDLKKSGHRICQIQKNKRKDHRKYLILKNIKAFRKHLTLLKLKLKEDEINIEGILIVTININIDKLNSLYNAKIPYFNNPIMDN